MDGADDFEMLTTEIRAQRRVPPMLPTAKGLIPSGLLFGHRGEGSRTSFL